MRYEHENDLGDGHDDYGDGEDDEYYGEEDEGEDEGLDDEAALQQYEV